MPDRASSTRLSDLVTLRTERVVATRDVNKPYVGLEHIVSGEPFLLGTARADSSISTNSVFYKGDILFGKLRPNLRKSLPAFFDGYCSTDILVLQPNPGVAPDYVARVFQREDVFQEAVRIAEGTKMPRTSWARLREYCVFTPEDDEEQFAIARILDAADEAIITTESLIAKLKVIKQGLLHDLLTRGLDENGKLRDPHAHPGHFEDASLGRIPKDWGLCPLEMVSQIASGITLGRQVSETNSLEVPYLRVANLQEGRVDLSEIKTVRILRGEMDRLLLQAGDVLLTEGGDFDKLGRGAVWDGQINPCAYQNHIFRVRTDPQVLLPEFLAAILMVPYGKRYFLRHAKQTTSIASINRTELGRFPVPCPGLEEQERIIAAFKEHERRIAEEMAYLAKLKSIKKGLMQDLLTGQVRVKAAPEITRAEKEM